MHCYATFVRSEKKKVDELIVGSMQVQPCSQFISEAKVLATVVMEQYGRGDRKKTNFAMLSKPCMK